MKNLERYSNGQTKPYIFNSEGSKSLNVVENNPNINIIIGDGCYYLDMIIEMGRMALLSNKKK